MAQVAVIGTAARVAGYALGGAVVLAAETDEEVTTAWHGLTPDVQVVIVTKEAARVVGRDHPLGEPPLLVVLPT